jgi:activating signal cointegrator 1
MTVISLLQPWASLVVMGAKKFETRSWNTTFRGELLIHASKGKHYGGMSCRELCYCAPFAKFIPGGRVFDKLPFGAIIGKVNMVDTIPTDSFHMPAVNELRKAFIGGRLIEWPKQEEMFGDYSPGRFAWILKDPVKFDIPIPASGKQGFWNYYGNL